MRAGNADEVEFAAVDCWLGAEKWNTREQCAKRNDPSNLSEGIPIPPSILITRSHKAILCNTYT